MENELRYRSWAYRNKASGMKIKIESQTKEIRKLRTVIRYLLNDAERDSSDGEEAKNLNKDDVDMELDGFDDCGGSRDTEGVVSDDPDAMENEEKLPFAVWDDDDKIYRCSLCSWEIFEDFCDHCATEHIVDEAKAKLHIEHASSVSTDHESMNPNRRLRPRGSTPLREIDYVRNLSGYTTDEYHALLARGATQRMCGTFSLEFTCENGIVAWADDDLFKTFSGNAMKVGDKWKIYLGRRIELDDDDLDGAQFMEDLLEEVLLFPSYLRGPLGLERAPKKLRWETVEESPGIWATRPVVDRDTVPDALALDGGNVCDEAEDCLSSDCDVYEGDKSQPEVTVKSLHEEEDEALEHALPRNNLGPVIEFEEYEADTEERTDEMLGWTGIYDPDRDCSTGPGFDLNSEQEDGTFDNSQHADGRPRESLALVDTYPHPDDSDDSADSDFDSQEEE